MHDAFELLKSIENGLDVQEIELEDILIEPEKEETIIRSESPTALEL